MWNLQYRFGLWSYLDSFVSSGAEALELVEKYTPNAKILDLGCGTSVNMPLAHHRYSHYHGVDISALAIQKARELGRPRASFEVADILSYQTSERYDAILLREVIYYFAADQAAGLLRRLSGMLEPTGKIFVQLYIDEWVDVVRNCGLPVAEERARKPPNGGVFVVLGPRRGDT